MRLMLASPTERPPSGPLWRHEIKWDGIRALVTVDQGNVEIHTRSGQECSARFPELVTSHLRDFDALTLDGEIVVLNHGAPDFRAAMQRLSPAGFRGSRARNPDTEAEALRNAPVQFMAFDILAAAGHSVLNLPWESRRELLEGAGIHREHVQVPPTYPDGAALFAATAEQEVEGVVSKRIDAPYRPGIRSEDWLKSVHRRTETFIVGGWRPLEGTRSSVGALLLGEFGEGKFRYRGKVGTGLSRQSGEALLDSLEPAPQSPFKPGDDAPPPEECEGTHWVRPRIAVDVTFLQHSHGGRLRQPVYKGLRLDVGVPHGR